MLEIQIMYKQGNSLKKISRETGYSINTVRKYIGETMPPTYKPRPVKISKLETYRGPVEELTKRGISVYSINFCNQKFVNEAAF